jgi:adenosylhomocysteine nucleosidase
VLGERRKRIEEYRLNLIPTAPLYVIAMPSEMRHILEVAENVERSKVGVWPMWAVQLDGRSVNLLLSGIGMINAGAALSHALGELQPRVVLNTGCAGAHHHNLIPGDVIVGTRYINHRSVTVLPNGDEAFLGMRCDPETVTALMPTFSVDDRIIELAEKVASRWSPSEWPFPGAIDRSPSVHFGPVGSADTWTQATDKLQRFNEEHGTLCEDMEAAALAHICHYFNLPFLSVKDISNNEFHATTDLAADGPSLEVVESELGLRSFAFTRRLLRDL